MKQQGTNIAPGIPQCVPLTAVGCPSQTFTRRLSFPIHTFAHVRTLLYHQSFQTPRPLSLTLQQGPPDLAPRSTTPYLKPYVPHSWALTRSSALAPTSTYSIA